MSSDARTAAEARVRRVAAVLGPVRDRLVFIGGSVLPLLVEVEARFTTPRSTKDVDAVAATNSYAQQHAIETALRDAGFTDDMTRHVGRWRAPFGEVFDLSFAGQHVGATGSRIDEMALATAVELSGDPPLRHVGGLGLLLMKCAAFRDRGAQAPHASKDLADLAVLLVGRAALLDECGRAEPPVQAAVREATTALVATTGLADALRSHFRDRRPVPPDTPDDLTTEAIHMLTQLAAKTPSPPEPT